MKNFIKTFILISFMGSNAFAQHPSKKHHPKRHLETLDRALNLSEEQEKQVLVLFEQMKPNKEMRLEKKEQRKKLQNEFSKFLSKKQMKKLRAIKKEERALALKKHQEHERLDEIPENKAQREEIRERIQKRVVTELKLTVEQKSQMQKVMTDHFSYQEAFMTKRKNSMKEKKRKFNAEMKQILSTEQFAKFQEMRKERHKNKKAFN
ncbi:MAG: hypothetical protein N4A45_01255 [Flavobacteriales bacterium]|nr:hypothetical protein [Flavobacteriales bacterium]